MPTVHISATITYGGANLEITDPRLSPNHFDVSSMRKVIKLVRFYKMIARNACRAAHAMRKVQGSTETEESVDKQVKKQTYHLLMLSLEQMELIRKYRDLINHGTN